MASVRLAIRLEVAWLSVIHTLQTLDVEILTVVPMR